MSKISKLVKKPNIFFRDFFEKRSSIASVEQMPMAQLEKIDTDNAVTVQPKKKLPVVQKKIVNMKPKIKSQSEYLLELTNFTRSFDVNSLKYKNEFIWPYLRSHFWVQLYLLGFGKNSYQLLPHRLQLGTKDNLKNYVRGLIKNKLGAIEIDELSEDKVGIDFLFLTVLNAAEQVELDDGSIYYHITDPIYEEACKLGNAKKIELIKVNSPALEKCTRYKYQPTFILSPQVMKHGFSDSIDINKHFFDVSKKAMPSLEFSEKTLKDTIDWELHTRDYCLEILKKINPKILFLNGFHYHVPWISAAHELGIVTVDVQHGIQVGWNPLYNDWYELPKEGYQGLPDYFWVWGEKEFNSINKVFLSKNHTPIIGGFPWLTRQLDYMPTLKDKVRQNLKTYEKVFVIILQNQKNVPEEYKRMIEESGDEVAWIIRHHPKGNKFKKEDFTKTNIKNVYIDEYFDRVSLARLFEVVDVCISAGSTVALEADHFGVYNIIFTEEGKNNYREEIEQGHFYYASDINEFHNIIKEVIGLPKLDRPKGNTDSCVQDTLKVLLTKLSNKEENL